MLDVGCWMLDVGCWMLDVRCWMLDVWHPGKNPPRQLLATGGLQAERQRAVPTLPQCLARVPRFSGTLLLTQPSETQLEAQAVLPLWQ